MHLNNLPSYCTALLSLKAESSLSFSEIANTIGKPEVWTTALFFGQAKADQSTAESLLDALGSKRDNKEISYQAEEDGSSKTLSRDFIIKGLIGEGMGGMIERGGTWEFPPKDPVLYRLYEVLVVYGWSYKALIHEKFGDGIMSAIGFRTSLEKKKDETGDRVVITLDGKFLPYSQTDQWDMSLSK
ncbi:cyanate lyase C-terminal domain-domain-containing protein [Naematelia encephala]|uniref:Cyanate hydratase n=1 Tax=Naematelia encephala TaxID=71784 RepID=A0A1Y2AMK0_9TREE|nr:cyanate lyase C-terminal domain-domain-containing protein [Naematelia encephala]